MSPRLDAHAHFFSPGYVALLPDNCRRVIPDEITFYRALAEAHNIAQVLAIGYEGEAWAHGNNGYIVALHAELPWVRPVAFVTDPAQLRVMRLAAWASQGFVGVTFYLLDDVSIAALAQVDDTVWRWLDDQAWLVSVNAHSTTWSVWQPILTRYPKLRLLISHLGLPPAWATPPTLAQAAVALAPVLALADYAGVQVKLSGFYALTLPNHAYPHRAAWPYVQVLAERYGPSRLLWASDFSPALEVVSFVQTVDVVEQTGLFTSSELSAIHGDNLATLLAQVEERK